jgi:hypothetical membrane protein
MTTNLVSQEVVKFTGLAGSLLVVLAAVLTGWRFSGKQGELYSPFNHFISELGELGVSAWARFFNFSLVAAGLLLLPCCLGLGLLIPGGWAKAGMLAGFVAAISVTCVGIFPMNNLTPHIIAATTFFRAGLVMMILFTIAIWQQPAESAVLPRTVNLAGSLAGLAYASFLILWARRTPADGETLDPDETWQRPTYWLPAVIEWAVFLTTILWFFTVAAAL